MNQKEAAKKLSFRVSLCEQAVHHLEFLKLVDNVPELKNPAVLRQALFRYEKYWLPLAVEHIEECLVAPLDIEWMWHCHMLNPVSYEIDCKTVVGSTVNHTLYSQTQTSEKQDKSREYWLQKYDENEVSFDLDLRASYEKRENEKFQSKISYNIIAAAQRQSTFYYQVSLPHYRDSKFLESSLLRYKQFLYMKTRVAQDFLVPCYDIDLIWHTHQLNPVAYKEDMVKIIGYFFNHDDSDNDRHDGSKLDNAGKETSENWKQFYDENFSMFGAMYRGKPPNGRLGGIAVDDAYIYGTRTYKIGLEKLALIFPSEGAQRSYRKILLKGSATKNGKAVDEWFSLKGHNGTPSNQNTCEWKDVGSYKLNTKVLDGISLELRQFKGRGCFSSETVVGQCNLETKSLVGNDTTDNEFLINSQTVIGNNIMIDVQGKCSIIEREKADIFLRNNTTLLLEECRYETVVIPDDVQELFGPVDIEKLPSGTSNLCKVALHRMRNKATDVVEVTVKVIHSAALMTSVVQVFYHDKMIALAHLIASEQLPLPTQVNTGVVTLNPRQGERAVLIKNHQGDWGVVLGKWKGFKRGKAGTSCFRAEFGSPGWLSARLYKFSTGKTTSVTYPFDNFSLDSCKVDLKRIIEIDTTKNEIGENIAAAFSVALLHVLCVPRPKGWKEGQTIDPEVKIRGKKAIAASPPLAFVMAAGLIRNTPSNYFISSNYSNSAFAIFSGRVIKYDGDSQELPGKGGRDASCDGCACSGPDDKNSTEFDSGIVGAGCGGCGGHACASTCGGGKGACVSDYKRHKAVNTDGSRSYGNNGRGDFISHDTIGIETSFFVTDDDCGNSSTGGDGGGCDSGGGFD